MPQGANIQNIIKQTIKDENIIEIGANSRIYTMPELEGHVFKDDPNKINMPKFLSDINLGQPVRQSKINQKILILKEEDQKHSIPNRNSTIWDNKAYKRKYNC